MTSRSTTGAIIETDALRDRLGGCEAGAGAGALRFTREELLLAAAAELVDWVFGLGGPLLFLGGGGGGGRLLGGGGGGGGFWLLRPGGCGRDIVAALAIVCKMFIVCCGGCPLSIANKRALWLRTVQKLAALDWTGLLLH